MATWSQRIIGMEEGTNEPEVRDVQINVKL